MADLTRRAAVKTGTALAAAAALTGPALLDWARAWAQTAPWKPEKGAQLSLLRWKYFVQAEDDAFVGAMDAFAKALDAYRIDNGQYPSTQQGLAVLVQAPSGVATWRGPYLQGDVPQDPWHMPYQYQSPGANGKDYELRSFGRDKVPGGTGDDALGAVGGAGYFDDALDMLASGDMLLVTAAAGGRVLCVATTEGKLVAAAMA